MLNRKTALIALALAGLGLAGCVDQSKYDRASEAAKTSTARAESLVQDKQSLEALAERKQARINELEAEVGALRDINSQLSGQIEAVRSAQSSLEDRLKGIRLGVLDPATDAALRELAAQYPDLIAYDSERGMVRFMSDLTFRSGSADLNEKAVAALQKLASIVAQTSGASYDLRVVGHTDSQQPSRSRDRFPTNRHLSAHRAIAVEQALMRSGVPGSRVEIVGWGEYRPAVPNTANGNTPQNRRVEIFFVPSSGGAPMTTDAAPMPPARPAPRRDEMPLK